VRKIISIILVGFIIVWTYNLFIDKIIFKEKVEEEPYRGIIRIWDIQRSDVSTGSMYPWLKDIIRAFEKTNPGVYVEFEQTDMESIYDAIKGKTDEEELPDIIPVDSNFLYFNLLEPLDEYFSEEDIDDFKDQVIKSVTYKEKIVAVPIAMGTNVLYINLDKFHERGVSPPVDGSWTYEEFIDALKQLNYDSDGDGIIDEYGFVSYVGIGNYNIWSILLSDGAEFINPKRLEYNFYGEKAIKGFDKLMRLKEEKVVPDSFGTLSQNEAWEMFYKDRKAAAIITGAWANNFLDSLHKSGEGFNYDIVSFPTGDKNLPTILSDDIFSYGVVKSGDPKKIAMCMKFLKFLTADGNQRSLEKLGLFTVKKGIDDMYLDNPRMKKIEDTLVYTEYIPFIDNKRKIDEILQREILNVILENKSSSNAVEDAKLEIDMLSNKN